MLGPKQIGKMFKPYDDEIQPLIDEIKDKECVVRDCADEATMQKIQGTFGSDLLR